MNSPVSQLLRLLTGTVSVLLVMVESPLWWMAVIPWAVLCVFGIIATIPALIVIGIGAGAAQADWMSDAFIIGLVFLMPTILAVAIAEFFSWRGQRGAGNYRLFGLIACPHKLAEQVDG
jgi:hypothetical protein